MCYTYDEIRERNLKTKREITLSPKKFEKTMADMLVGEFAIWDNNVYGKILIQKGSNEGTLTAKFYDVSNPITRWNYTLAEQKNYPVEIVPPGTTVTFTI